MRDLKEYIIEGIFDTDEDTIDKSIKDQIKQFLKDNFKGYSSCKISRKPNTDGKYEVSSTENILVVNKKITSLTNGLFIWTNVSREFNCWGCKSLTSLEGAPKKIGGDFSCYNCASLISLEGAPEEVGGNFNCYNCTSLKSLKGSPKKIGGDFDCSENDMKFTKNDIKKVSNVKGKIYI